MRLLDIFNKTAIVTGIVTTVLASGVIAAGGFIAHAVFSPKVDLSGRWIVCATTDSTSYKAYKNLTSVFEFQILQKDDKMISGTGEKMWDINPDGSITSYKTTRRDRVSFNGTITKVFWGKTEILFECTNYGLRYKTSSTYYTDMIKKDSLYGTFTTTVAQGSGHLKMKRKE